MPVKVRSPLGHEEPVEQLSRTSRADVIRRRVDQQLESGRRHASIAGKLRHHRREGAAGAVAPYRDTFGIGAEFGDVVEGPPVCRECVNDGRGSLVLRSQPIVDRQDVEAAVPADQPALIVVAVDAAD